MKDIAFRGEKIALNLMSEGSYLLKEDNSILTKTDTEISELSNKILSDLLRTPVHILITEENGYNSNICIV